MEKKGNKRFYIGVIFIAIGLILIFERLNIIPGDIANWLISWQMLLVVIGLFLLAGRNTVSGVVLICIGGFFLLPEITNIPYGLRRIAWPLILVAAGIVLLSKQRGGSRQIKEGTRGRAFDQFDDLVIFGGREIYVDAQDFKGGRSTCIFGGIEYDLRQAKLAPQGAVVDCICIFGGAGMKVPSDWYVKNEVTTIFGSFTDKRGENLQQVGIPDPSKTIIVKGMTIFGGVEIKLSDRNGHSGGHYQHR